MKVAIIGAASVYTPMIIKSILRMPSCADVREFGLMDLDEPHLRIVASFCDMLCKRNDAQVRIQSGTELSEAIAGASIVITMYRVGGLAAREKDETLASQMGIVAQETQGFCGFASALRNISILGEIVDCTHAHSPDALLLNVTNPVGIMTKACSILGAKAVGICELPYKMQGVIAQCYGATRSGIELDYVGLNHLAWVRKVKTSNEDVTADFFSEHLLDALVECRPANIPNIVPSTHLVRALAAFPSPYLTYYYERNRILKAAARTKENRARKCLKINELLRREYRAGRMDSWESILAQRGGYLLGETVAVFIAQYNGTSSGGQIIANVRNGNTIRELSEDVIVEVPCKVEDGAVKPIPAEVPLSAHMRGLMSICSSYESITAEAGIKGDYDRALLALATNLFVLDATLARKLLDRTLQIFETYLPQFHHGV